MADAALVPTPQIVSRVQAANIFRLLLVISFFPFLFSVCRSFQTITRDITSNAKRTPKPTHAARVELAPTDPTRLNSPTIIVPVPGRVRITPFPHIEDNARFSAAIRSGQGRAVGAFIGEQRLEMRRIIACRE